LRSSEGRAGKWTGGLIKGRTFGAKAKRVRRHGEHIDTQELQSIVGEEATREGDAKVDLMAPEVWIRSVITGCGDLHICD